jgi:hypothetical protein
MPPKRSSTGGSASSNASKKPKTEAQQSRVSTNFRSGKGPAAAAAAAAAAAGKKAPVSVEAAIKKEAPISSASAKDGPTLSVADPNYDAHYKEVKAMMGGKAPSALLSLSSGLGRGPLCSRTVHGEVNGLNRVDDILRLFDLTYGQPASVSEIQLIARTATNTDPRPD